MTAKITTAAMALVANGLCLLWPSATAPNIATRPARCVMAIRHNACMASAPCACAIPDENRTVFVLEADLPLADSADPAPLLSEGREPVWPRRPGRPGSPYENCKPRKPARIAAKATGNVMTSARPGLSRSASAHSLHEGADIHKTIVRRRPFMARRRRSRA